MCGPLVAEPWEPLGGLGAGTGSSPGTVECGAVQCGIGTVERGGSAVQCRATRGRASPDIIPVTHIGHFS